MSFTKSLQEYIQNIGFEETTNLNFEKKYKIGCSLKITINDTLNNAFLIYPDEIRNISSNMNNTTYDDSHKENLVVFRCIDQLLEKGYSPYDLELEKRWTLGHTSKSGRADIVVYKRSESINKLNEDVLCIIECKTYGKEFNKATKETEDNGGQLFSYFQQDRSCEWLILYSNNLQVNEQIEIKTIKSLDDKNILELQKRGDSILTYENAKSTSDLFTVWSETYNKEYVTDVLFTSEAYSLGLTPLKKCDLKDIPQNNKIINQFEEILRHNNVSDKENAFNRLIALFICKIVDESSKSDNDVLDFQYKVSVDTYETLQDRLQRLHKEGMKEFMKEEIFYLPDTYADDLFKQYKNKRNNLIKDLKEKIKFLKFYSNNDFAFKDVHNEELFYQNGKVVVEMVQLFENYKIIGSNNLQLLGDLFEQLLNKGFKQSEGQFFTPYPITRFIFKSLPLDRYLNKIPKTIDYACGAGHFLTEAYDSINDLYSDNDRKLPLNWEMDYLYGIEKDYRLARVSKISMFMHGANKANIIFGDGLDNYEVQNVKKESFDLLVANPPYSVDGFKEHLGLSENKLDIIEKISIDGSEIETCFVERINQLLKPKGICAVILPNTLLNKDQSSFNFARECILENFYIKAIAQFGKGTFGATTSSTIVVFLEKFNEPPKRVNLVLDSVDNIMSNTNHLEGLEDDDIFKEYLEHIDVSFEDYQKWLNRVDFSEWENHSYFREYYRDFNSKKIKNKKYNNENFYSIYMELEKEKLKIFGLIYKQKTVISEYPSETDAQKQFLGFEWSNRKGQEGIKIKSDDPSSNCGCLYSDDNTSLSTIILNSFNEDYDTLVDNCFIADTKDLINFNTVKFSKEINTARVQRIKKKIGYKIYSFNDELVFNLFIGKRVLQEEISSKGIPIYSANVYEPFGNIDISENDKNVFKSKTKLVTWGIDGDWMVNIMEENRMFYPTDHCGVLEVKIDDILPEYLRYALYSVGKQQRFSRSNRASIQRLKTLKIQVPNLTEQREIVDSISCIESEIKRNKNKITNKKSEIFKLYKSIKQNSQTTDLAEYADIISGYAFKSNEFSKDGVYVVRISDLDENSVCLHRAKKFNSLFWDNNERYRILEKDILVGMSGSIGKNSIYLSKEKALLNQRIACIRCKNTDNYRLVFCMINDPDTQKYIQNISYGNSQKNFSGKDLEILKVPKLSIEQITNFNGKANDLFKEIEELLSSTQTLKDELENLIFKFFGD